jgi:hypothetical protein
MLSWFNAREFERLGEELAILFMEEKPSAEEGNRKFRRTNKARGGRDPAQDPLRKLVSRISTFEEKKKANIYKTAKFANAFKWKLIEAGYDRAYADAVTKELVIHFR